ncbi:MAG: endonuclease [Bacteroidota bacterium]
MKKITTLILFAVIANSAAFAQAVLPVSWGFAGSTLPATGWSTAGTGFAYYTGSGNPQPAAKFTAAGDMLIINFNSTPGTLTYDIAGNPPPSGTWAGNFAVEESANGTTWTTVIAYTALAPAATYVNHSNTLLSTSRYVRFNFVTHTVGNVGLDNINISTGVSSTQEMSVLQGAASIVNGGTYTAGSAVGTPLPITFTVDNLGTTGVLNVTAATLSGPAMADYSVTTAMPLTIAGLANTPLMVTFTPSVAGTRNAVLTLVNNDPTANPYIINLNGIGGTLASEPTSQPSSLVFPVNKSYRIIGSFTAAAGSPDGYIVLRKTGSAPTDLPVDGAVYQRGDMIGTSKVVYSSNATGFMPNDIRANTQYYFAIYAYNGVGTFRNYLTTSPLTGNVTTSGTMVTPGYYSSITTGASTFVTDLHTLTNTHTIQLYSNYGANMMNHLYQRDTTGNTHVATCVYSGENIVYTGLFDWVTNNMSREHTYCQSWQPTVNDPSFTSRPEYNDYHMITPTDQNNVNAIRSNNPLGIVVGTPIYTWMGCKIGNDANGHKVFEPRDSDKGDAARCMLYQCICYTGTGTNGNTDATYGGSWSLPNYISGAIPYGQNQNVLKLWNQLDPPDNFEISRNDYVDSLQGNRNPFIDHPEYVCYINFDSMIHIAAGCNIGISENTVFSSITLAPNPSNGNFMINYVSAQHQQVSIKLFDVVGRMVFNSQEKMNEGFNSIEMNIPNIGKGVYSIEFISETGKQTKRLIIE